MSRPPINILITFNICITLHVCKSSNLGLCDVLVQIVNMCEELVPILHTHRKVVAVLHSFDKYVIYLPTSESINMVISSTKVGPNDYRNSLYVNFTFGKCDVLVPICTMGVKLTKW